MFPQGGKGISLGQRADRSKIFPIAAFTDQKLHDSSAPKMFSVGAVTADCHIKVEAEACFLKLMQFVR